MGNDDDDQGGVNTPASAVLTGISNLFRLVFVTIAIATMWLVALCVSAYYMHVSTSGSFSETLATKSLSALILLVAAPLLFSVVLRKSSWYSVAVAAVATGLLVLARCADDVGRDVLIDFGIGLWFVLAIDFNIVHRFKAWREKLQGEAREAASDIHLVL